MNYYLSKNERDRIFSMMSSAQQTFLMDELKRGKRTTFANILARDKGDVITENMTLNEVESLLGEWRLLDVIDAGPGYKHIKPPYKCQCGKVLRYQYIIEHLSTKEIRKFGIVHFEEHTGFPPHVIKEITQGFEKIDYELDEILTKYVQNWTLQLDLPEGFMVPEEILKVIGLRLPLLDRQVAKLSVKIREYKMSLRSIRGTYDKATSDRAIALRPSKRIEIDQAFVKAMTPYLKSGTISARDLSKKLLDLLGNSEDSFERQNERQNEQQHELYANIVIYMDGLCAKGDFICVSHTSKDVRYRRKQKLE